MKTLPVLQTERLILQPIALVHTNALYQLVYSDPDVAIFYNGEVETLERTREKVMFSAWKNEHSGDQGWGSWAVVRKEDDQIVGQINLGGADRTYYTILEEEQYSPFVPLDTEIGYAFGKAFWGQGYASEAARAVIDYAFETLCIPRIVTPTDGENVSSQALLRRLGFRMQQSVHPEYGGVVGILDNPLSRMPVCSSSNGTKRKTIRSGGDQDVPLAFETDQLMIRGMTKEDCDAVDQMLDKDPKSEQSFGRMHTYETVYGNLMFVHESQTGTRIREAYSGKTEGLGTCIIENKSSREPVGIIHLGPAARNYWIRFEHDPDPPLATFEVDLICIVDPSFRNRNYATEACRRMLDFALRDLRLARLVCHVGGDNASVLKWVERLGFRIEQNLHPNYGGWVAVLDNNVLEI